MKPDETLWPGFIRLGAGHPADKTGEKQLGSQVKASHDLVGALWLCVAVDDLRC